MVDEVVQLFNGAYPTNVDSSDLPDSIQLLLVQPYLISDAKHFRFVLLDG